MNPNTFSPHNLDKDEESQSLKKNVSSTNHQVQLEKVWAQSGSSPAGLDSAEAQRRLANDGPNALPDPHRNMLRELKPHFWGPIPWMIEAAALISFLIRDWTEFCIISVLLIVNGLVGFWQEHQAGNAVDALKRNLALMAQARRDGRWIRLPANKLVKGDLVHLKMGDIVPADAILVDGSSLEVDQSALTGESLPVSCKLSDEIYAGSIVKLGEANAIVSSTGIHTYYGKTAKLVDSAQMESHFQKAILRIGRYLIAIGVTLVILIISVALFRGEPTSEILKFALVLTVASIPVAMPTVLSVTLAMGARILSGKQAIVSRLAAIEELSGMNVLCSDKTGTLTKNELTLDEPVLMPNVAGEDLFLCAALASRRESADAIDMAIFNMLPNSIRLSDFTVHDFIPFDPVKKHTEAKASSNTTRAFFNVAKGAPQAILRLLPDPPSFASAFSRIVDEFAARGYRSLAVARTDATGQWEPLGILPLFDPPRSDSKETIRSARRLGIEVKLVTGDQLAIAEEIAKKLNLGNRFLDTNSFRKNKGFEDNFFHDQIEAANGFAQVFPEDKYHIVDSLQNRGYIVGMTGDGANDAPALKKADVGIAVSGATDAARAAADIVLTAPGLSVVIDAIQESRKIFQRMTNYAIYRIAETIRVLSFMTLAILFFDFYPVTAVMIVLLALLNDGAILSIAVDRVQGSPKPTQWDLRQVLGLGTVLGIMGVFSSFGLFYIGEKLWHLDQTFLQTLIYLKLSVAGHLTVFVSRTRGPFWSIRPAKSLLFAVFGTQVAATLIAVFGWFMHPIGWHWAAVVWAYSLSWFLINDFVKIAAYKFFSPPK